MKPSRLLPLCFLASLCAGSAAAQTAPAAPPQTNFTLAPQKSTSFNPLPATTIPALIAAPDPTQPSPTFILKSGPTPGKVNLGKAPQQSSLCFKIRTYGAPNVEDLKPGSPTQPPTTCTDSAAAQMKSADFSSHR